MGKRRHGVAARQFDDDAPPADPRRGNDTRYSWIVYAIAALMVGGLMGYVLAIQNIRSADGAAPAPGGTASSSAPVFDEGALRTYREILAREPLNLQAAVNAANLLYDAQRYAEAIPLYQRAFALNPSDIDVSTDLGTALWYSGRPDDALAQYDRSLALNATHAQTLFNIGIVKSEGKRDYPGALAAWEELLAMNPTYPNAARVRSLITDAQQKSREHIPVPARTGA